jgi:hypothetical protein
MSESERYCKCGDSEAKHNETGCTICRDFCSQFVEMRGWTYEKKEDECQKPIHSTK